MQSEDTPNESSPDSEEPADAAGAETRPDAFGSDTLGQRFAQLVRRLPGVDFARQQVGRVESALLRNLKSRLDRVSSAGPAPRSAAGPESGVQPEAAAMLTELLERSMTQSKATARADVYRRVLAQLVPDEARILSALSDGGAYPLIHVGVGPPVGALTTRVQDNVSNVGRAAGVMLLDQVPAYIAHLRALGLVETGPEDRQLLTKYEITESDELVNRAREAIEKNKRTARILRRTLKISAFGRELWEACVGADNT